MFMHLHHITKGQKNICGIQKSAMEAKIIYKRWGAQWFEKDKKLTKRETTQQDTKFAKWIS